MARAIPMQLATIGGFFAAKLAVGAGIVLVSARALSVEDFAAFSQLFLFAGYLTLLASGGGVNGVIQRVAAVRGDRRAEFAICQAGVALWVAASILLLGGGLLLAQPLSRLLVGDERFAQIIPLLIATIVIGGLGQIFTALLTGRRKLTHSLGSQAVGLLVGGSAATGFLIAKRPAEAVLAFTTGTALTTLVAGWLAKDVLVGSSAGNWRPEFQALLRHAGAFATVAVVPPLVLFVLRDFYQDAFGLAALGYWLAANRISDISTQVMGLYLAQVFLPQLSALEPGAAARRRAATTALAGAMLFSLPLLVFLIAPRWLVGTFLGRDFYPAISFIIGYMVGDMLRTVTSVTMMGALARGRTRVYAAVELGASAMFAVVTILLISEGLNAAPWLGYIASHLAVSAAAGAWMFSRGSFRR